MKVKDAVDEIFKQKAKEYKLKTGDISPHQHYMLGVYCDKIEAIIDEWVEQNKR